MNNVIVYKGEITFKIMHGDKVVKTFKQHNEGTQDLMTFLIKCLGSNYDELNAPKYIRLFYTENEGMPLDLLSSEITLRPVITNYAPQYKEDYDEAKSSVSLTFLVPSSLIDQTNNTFNRIALYSSNSRNDPRREHYMAWVPLPDPNIRDPEDPTQIDPDQPSEISISSGESLMIIWEMTLQNYEIDYNA